jgi:hypothetical protein
MLPIRLGLFGLCQAGFALVLGGWERSFAWWPLTASAANIVTIGLLVWRQRAEGERYFDLFRFDPSRWRTDLALSGAVIAAAVPLAVLPNLGLAQWLFGDPEIAKTILIRPLPLWAAALAFTFPLTIAFAELPAYFGYAMPRLVARTGSTGLAIAISALFLAAQHMALPLVFDGRFILWRLLMFLPLALFLGLVLRWRPSLMPYIAIGHGLLDASVVVMVVVASA